MAVDKTWEFAKKLINLSNKEFSKIFPNMTKEEVFNLSLEEVQDKVDNYEYFSTFKLGDVVEDKEGIRYIILDEDINNGCEVFHLFSENGCVECMKKSLLRKVTSTDYVAAMLNYLQLQKDSKDI